MHLQRMPQIGVHFAQKYVYAGTGEHAWFADLDPRSQLCDNIDLSDRNVNSDPSYRAPVSHMVVRPVVNKVRILKYRLKHSRGRLFKSWKKAGNARQYNNVGGNGFATSGAGGSRPPWHARIHCLSGCPG